MNRNALPLLARVLLRVFVPADWRADILRDLEEDHLRHRRRSNGPGAYLRLFRQVSGFCFQFGLERLAEFRTLEAFDSLDLKLALRSIRRAPGMAILSVVALATGIGMSAGVFALIKGSFFADLPFDGGDRVVLVQDYDRTGSYAVDLGGEEYLRRRDALESFESLGAYYSRPVVFGLGEARGRTVSARYVTPEVLDMTGVSPLFGRLPDQDDAREGAQPIVLLPYFLWTSGLGADPEVLGTTVYVGGQPRTVVGVMPEGFGFPQGNELWIPLDAKSTREPLGIVGKLKPGVDIRTARAELATVARPDPTQAQADHDIVHLVTRLNRPVVSDATTLVLAVPVAVFVLLLMVMATNVANLVLARNARRAGEIAVRSALGATRLRIMGQLTVEVVLLVAAAATAGLVLAGMGLEAFEARVELPIWTDLRLDPWAVVFTVGLGGLTTLVAGWLPAARATSGSIHPHLKHSGRGGDRLSFGRITGSLIVVELAICVGFLSAAAVLGRGLLSFGFTQYGLPARETLVTQIYFGWPDELRDPETRLTEGERTRIRQDFLLEATRKQDAIREAVLEIPGVSHAAWGSRFPGNQSSTATVEVQGGKGTLPVTTEVAEVGRGYFQLLGVRPTQGRDFTDTEMVGEAGVVIVNQPFVDRHLPGTDPMGRRIRFTATENQGTEPGEWLEIVGVVPDLGLNPADPGNRDGVYLPLPRTNVARLALKGIGDPSRWTPGLVEKTRRVDPGADVQWSRTLDSLLREAAAIYRGLGVGFLLFGALALLLSAASIHALTGSMVTNRTHEIGVRQALGASSWAIILTVLRRTAAQLALGGLLGAGLAWGLLSVGTQFPWPLSTRNPLALAGVAGVLVVANFLAVAAPLGRALAIRPADALRSE